MSESLSSTRRFSQIIHILKKHKLTQGVDPVKLRLILEDLGPTFVKIGQIMSSREDMFSERYCKELMKLRDEVAPLDYEKIKVVLSEEYGCQIDEIFSNIELIPLGSASIAQVHRATLISGEDVVIKVQRPGIYEMMERDIALIRRSSSLLKLNKALGNVVDINIVLDEFWHTAKEEMDFNQEAEYAILFAHNYQDVKYIGTPKIYREYSTAKVLVMEYIGGFDIGEHDALLLEGYDLKEIAAKLADNYLAQIVDEGFFHADPHCGNLKIRDGKIVWIDFGMMGILNSRDRELMKRGLQAVVFNDAGKVSDVIMALGVHDDEVVYPQLLSDMESFCEQYVSINLSDINLAVLMQDIFNICHKHHIQMPKGITMLARGLVSFESTLALLDPKTSVLEIASQHLKHQARPDIEKILKDGSRKTYEATGRMLEIPIQFSDILKMARHGQFKLNLDLTDSKEPLHRLDKMVNRMVVVIFAAALLVGSSLICTTDMQPKFFGIPAIGLIGYLGAIVMGMWLFIRMLSIHKQDHRR